MMPHVDDGTLHALLDGALRAESPERAAEVEAHMAACADCRARLDAADELRGEASAILDATDHAELTDRDDLTVIPPFSEVVRRGADRRATGAEGSREPGRHRRQARWTRRVAWAASLVLALGTGYLIRDLAGPTVDDDRTPTMLSEPDGPATAPAVEEDARAERPATGEASMREAGAAGAEGAAEDRAAGDQPRAGNQPRAVDREGAAAAPARDIADRAATPPSPETPAPSERTEATEKAGETVPAAQAVTSEASPEASRASARQREAEETLRVDSPASRLAAVQDASARWSVVTAEEARTALDGPLYVLPRAELVEIFALADATRPRILTLQRLQSGVPVQVTQWRGGEEDSVVVAPGGDVSTGAERTLAASSAGLPDAALPNVNIARVVRDDYILELTGSLPAALLSVLGETAMPAP